jgi:hypothetical protein
VNFRNKLGITDISAISASAEEKGVVNNSTDVDTVNVTRVQYSSFLANQSVNKSWRYNQNHRFSFIFPDSSVANYGNATRDYTLHGKKLAPNHESLGSVKEREEDKYTTLANFKKSEEKSNFKPNSESKTEGELMPVSSREKIMEQSRNKMSNIKANSVFARHMEKQNIENPLFRRQILAVTSSPDMVITKKKSVVRKTKKSQSLPKFRGLLEKTKSEKEILRAEQTILHGTPKEINTPFPMVNLKVILITK